MFKPLPYLMLTMGLAWSGFTVAKPLSFASEWKAEVNRRLRHEFPSTSTRRPSESGVSVTAVAQRLGISKSAVAKILNLPEYFLSYEQASTLAGQAGTSPETLLATDLLDRFRTSRDLDAAMAGENSSLHNLLLRLYVRRIEDAQAPPSRIIRTTQVLIPRWRALVKARLSEVLPSPRVSTVATHEMSKIINRSRSLSSFIINGPQHLTYDFANRLGEYLGRDPEWLLGADLLDEFESLAELDLATRGETETLRAMMVRLYAGRVSGCQNILNRRIAASELNR